jgi:hypothetical protein
MEETLFWSRNKGCNSKKHLAQQVMQRNPDLTQMESREES